MRSIRWTTWCWSLGILLFVAFVIWPLIDQQLMQSPMTDGLAALRNGKIAQFAQCFTPDARITTPQVSMSIDKLINHLKPLLEEGENGSSVRFGGYSHLLHHASTVTADVTFIYDIQNDDIPYPSLPTRWTERVTLEKVNLFSWKIKEIHLYDDALNAFVKHWIISGNVRD